jgi:hypothetical protein
VVCAVYNRRTYWAFQYLLTAGGQELETSYPYTAEDGTCAFDATKIAARLTNYTFATTPCEQGSCPTQDDVLRTQLVSKGPVSICVNAETWSDWSGPEPMMGSDCPGDADELDHCVQVRCNTPHTAQHSAAQRPRSPSCLHLLARSFLLANVDSDSLTSCAVMSCACGAAAVVAV